MSGHDFAQENSRHLTDSYFHKSAGDRTAASVPQPTVTIRVSGKLFSGHLAYLDQLVQSAADCRLWPLLSLAHLEELDRAALLYLIRGENQVFSMIACPNFIREWMDHEKGCAA